jgi:hypothetical protein
MAAPGQIRDATLKDLRAARVAMNSADWLLGLQGLSAEERKHAALCKIDTHHMIVELENAKLADIAAKLKANEAAITTSTKNMREKLAELKKVKQIIDSIAGVLQVLGRVLPLLVPI